MCDVRQTTGFVSARKRIFANIACKMGGIPGGRPCVVPKMPIPGVGCLAYFKDTEGHIFGAMQADPAAKQDARA
jgi:hypothetical protein